MFDPEQNRRDLAEDNAKDNTTVEEPKVVMGSFANIKGVKVYETRDLTQDQTYGIMTGVTGQTNNWLLMAEQAGIAAQSDCIVCLGPRPLMRIIPPPPELTPKCMIPLMSKTNLNSKCSKWDKVYPLAKKSTTRPIFSSEIAPGNFTCFYNETDATFVGHINSTLCKTNQSLSTWVHRKWSDIWWLCGGYVLRDALPRKFYGMNKRYKLADQVASGFESFPILSAIFPVTPNKNVDRINYIHYNVLKLTNYTEDRFNGVHEQLAATSLMAFQNRIGLDMLLGEKGGVCGIFGEQCCTFIPNNTAPDGKLTRAIEGLRTLNTKMQDHSGIDTFKGLASSILMSVAVFAALLTLCGCCCIPCIRALIVKLIATALGPQPKECDKQASLTMMSNDDDDEINLSDLFLDPENLESTTV
uniref:Uncharacterized protein n=1 Tax=Sphaeramia orbicularis TaxID=375764 RepID=A0A673B4M7_9TELE